MSWVAIRAKIKAKLDGLVVAGTLGHVYNGEQMKQSMDVPVYPCAELIRAQSEPEYFTNREDMQSYVFLIRLLTPLTGDDWDTQEIAMDPVVDAVVQAFLDDADLTGSVDGRIEPIAMSAVAHTWGGKLHRADTVTLKCRKITGMA